MDVQKIVDTKKDFKRLSATEFKESYLSTEKNISILLNHLYKNQEYTFICRLFESTEFSLSIIENHQIVWKSFFKIGKVEQSWNVLLKLFRKLDLKQKLVNLYETAQEAQREFGLKPEITFYSLKCHIHLGDIARIKKIVESECKSSAVEKFFAKEENIEELIYLINRQKWILPLCPSLSSYLIAIITAIKTSNITIEKFALEVIYDNLVFDSIDNNLLYFALLNISIVSKRKELGNIVLKIIPNNAFNEKVGSKDHFVKIFEPMPDRELSNYDLGIDLFNENAVRQGIIPQIKKLEKNINYLKKIGRESDLDLLIRELEKLDPNHRIVKRYQYDKEHNEEVYNIADIEKDLEQYLLDIEQKYEINHEAVRPLSIAVGALIKTESLDKLLAFEKDYVTALIHMQEYDSVLKLIDFLESKLKSEDPKDPARGYLKAYCMIKTQKYYKALDEITIVLESIPLGESELLSFYYLKATALFQLKKYADARVVFSYIESKRPNFANVRQKIKNCE